ncbi:class F sortase [Ornithinimicrobium sp. INDO-MA30-4]|uniref:class F sortase n=1 Tax=Ornithinimicrobium sp. INDO-MA30-4 TaxID=2908651 RepID=UPI001F37F0BF|nr:class F sortase [Ornithinimicrobium sp. INDO-MA30-4]UJH69931.1 class F sortase [Ornithinimicrobium sp. INDO-MA30-4]
MAPLRQAEVGTLIDVELADGTTRTYEVVGREQFDKGDLPVADLFERAGPERLVLITCTGEWQADVGSYTDNVVIAATPVPDE